MTLPLVFWKLRPAPAVFWTVTWLIVALVVPLGAVMPLTRRVDHQPRNVVVVGQLHRAAPGAF